MSRQPRNPAAFPRTLMSGVSALVLLALTVQVAAGAFDRIAPLNQRGGDRINVRHIAEAVVRRFEHTRRRQTERPALAIRVPARRGVDPRCRVAAVSPQAPVRLLEVHLLALPPPLG